MIQLEILTAPRIRSSKIEEISAARCGHDTWNFRAAIAAAGYADLTATDPTVFGNCLAKIVANRDDI